MRSPGAVAQKAIDEGAIDIRDGGTEIGRARREGIEGGLDPIHVQFLHRSLNGSRLNQRNVALGGAIFGFLVILALLVPPLVTLGTLGLVTVVAGSREPRRGPRARRRAPALAVRPRGGARRPAIRGSRGAAWYEDAASAVCPCGSSESASTSSTCTSR